MSETQIGLAYSKCLIIRLLSPGCFCLMHFNGCYDKYIRSPLSLLNCPQDEI